MYSVLAVGITTTVGITLLLNAFYNAFDIGSGGSDYKVINSTTSPNKNYAATSYEVTGGGAAGWCYKLIKIIEPSVIDKMVFKSKCSTEIEVQWVGDNNLDISHSNETPFQSEAEWNEVKISYSLIESNK
jgi:hypothetical protein